MSHDEIAFRTEIDDELPAEFDADELDGLIERLGVHDPEMQRHQPAIYSRETCPADCTAEHSQRKGSDCMIADQGNET